MLTPNTINLYRKKIKVMRKECRIWENFSKRVTFYCVNIFHLSLCGTSVALLMLRLSSRKYIELISCHLN